MIDMHDNVWWSSIIVFQFHSFYILNITFNENALLRDLRKKDGSFGKIYTTALILKISLPNLLGTPWIGHRAGLYEKNCLFYKRNQGSGLFWTAVQLLIDKPQCCNFLLRPMNSPNAFDLIFFQALWVLGKLFYMIYLTTQIKL